MALKAKTFNAVITGPAGERKQVVSMPTLVYSATIQSMRTNTGHQYIGDSTLTTANGQEFQPGDVAEAEPPSERREQYDLSKIYVCSDTAVSEFRISAWIRE